MALRKGGTRRVFAPGRQKAATNWARLSSIGFVNVPANTKVFLAAMILSNPGIGETVRRTRGQFSVVSDQAVAVEQQIGAVGFMVVNDVAAGIGVGSLPDPVSDENDDGWFVWQGFQQQSSGGGGVVSIWQWELDSKAMRRVEEGFQVAVIVANASAIHGFDFAIHWSILTSLS